MVEKHGPGADSFPSIKMLIAEGEEVLRYELKLLIAGHYHKDC